MRQTSILRLLLIAVFTTAVFTTLTGCGPSKEKERMVKFEESFRAYAKHLRWGHFHEVSGFMTAAHVTPAIASIPSLKNVRITSVEPLNWIVDESQESISGNIRVDYYLEDRGVVKQTSQPQIWQWFEDSQAWKLDTGLPQLN